MQMRCCAYAFIKFEFHKPFKVLIAVNLCIYFPEHALFLKQSGEFEILYWFVSYELFLSCKWPKKDIFYHKFS